MTIETQTHHIELFIARLLRWGVIISFTIVGVGILLVLITGQTGYQSIRLDDLSGIVRYHAGPPDYPNSFNAVLTGVTQFKPYALISLGLLILIALPVMRVAVSVGAFLIERDWIYVAITAFVLGMLILSFLLGILSG